MHFPFLDVLGLFDKISCFLFSHFHACMPVLQTYVNVVVFVFVLFNNVVLYISNYSTDRASCTTNHPVAPAEYQFPNKLPGELYDADQQCQWQFGAGARLCSFNFGKVGSRSGAAGEGKLFSITRGAANQPLLMQILMSCREDSL